MSDRNLPGKEWLETLFDLAGVETSVEVKPESDCYWLVIDDSPLTSEQTSIAIGSQGAVLDSLQYLVNTVSNLNAAENEQTAYTVELGGYRVKREAQLRQLAENAAEKARQTGQEVEIDSLSAAERRQIHTIFKEWTDLETESRGQEPYRKLVVRLK